MKQESYLRLCFLFLACYFSFSTRIKKNPRLLLFFSGVFVHQNYIRWRKNFVKESLNKNIYNSYDLIY
ncbi:hypothetical protein Peur_042745 [Populus x canadensis]